jgi:alkylation response protein AidB-like acyl-CoA dehydrogenase
MHFELDAEQRAVVETTRAFVRRELVPHEDTVERDARLDPHLLQQLKDRAISAGLYAANMPEEVGGGGLDTLTWMLMERELGFTGYALQMLAVARPSRILLACSGSQRDEYLLPTVAGQRMPGDDRTGGRLRPAGNAHQSSRRPRRRLGVDRHQALHQSRRPRRLCDRVRRHR